MGTFGTRTWNPRYLRWLPAMPRFFLGWQKGFRRRQEPTVPRVRATSPRSATQGLHHGERPRDGRRQDEVDLCRLPQGPEGLRLQRESPCPQRPVLQRTAERERLIFIGCENDLKSNRHSQAADKTDHLETSPRRPLPLDDVFQG